MNEERWEVWAKHVLSEIERHGTIQRDQAEAINEMKIDLALIKQQTNRDTRVGMAKGGIAGTGLLSLVYAIWELFVNKNN